MVDIDFSGLESFLSALEAEQKRFNADISVLYQKWVQHIFYDIIELTPQWSGNLAANWYLSLGAGQQGEQTIAAKAYLWPLPHYVEPHQRGDEEAVSISKARFGGETFGYSDQVFIYNPTSIAQEVEDQSIPLRGVNLLDGRVAMIAHAQSFYSTYMPQL